MWRREAKKVDSHEQVLEELKAENRRAEELVDRIAKAEKDLKKYIALARVRTESLHTATARAEQTEAGLRRATRGR